MTQLSSHLVILAIFLGDNRNNYQKPVGQIISQIHPGYSVCLNQGTRIQNSISILNIFNRVLINILSTLDTIILASKKFDTFWFTRLISYFNVS